MSDTETTTTAEPTEKPKTGLAAADAVMEAHWAKQAEGAEGEETDDDQEQEPQQPQQPQKKKAGLVKALREERAARKQASAQIAQLQAQIDELKKGAAAPGGIDRERLKKEPLQVLLEAEADDAALLDALQKRAMEQGGLSPAAQKMFDKQAKDNAALREEIAKMQQGLTAKTDEQENAAGWAALQHEAAKVDAYPELKGWEWHELEAPIEQAIQYLAAKGHERVKPDEVLGLVNAAFKHNREASLKRWGVTPPAAEPPKKAPTPPAKASKKTAATAATDDGDELPPVEPTGSRRKVRLPSDAEIQRRVSRQLSQTRLSC